MLSALPVWGQPDLGRLLRAVEAHYNRPRTIQVLFEQIYTLPGRAPVIERGLLSLQKPGRMRWQYSSPEGKLFLSDGKDLFFYNPSSRRVEKSKFRESDDLRAPLAFLIGKLDFARHFREFRTRPEGPDTAITALPRSAKASFTQVQFTITPESRIRLLAIKGQDESIMQFRLDQERLNPPLEAGLFRFRMPPGAELVEVDDSSPEAP